MWTYFAITEIFKEFIIENMLIYGDDLEKAVGIMFIPWGLIVIIIFIVMDIVFIPFYILVGIIWLIIKGIRLISG